ncbi:hypothetical protein LguiA_023333 [Lonicera macranthoides]
MKEQKTCINFRKSNTLDENNFNLMEAAEHHAPDHDVGGAGMGAGRGAGTGAGRGVDKA